MNTEELIEIARECCSYPVKVSDYHWCGEGEFIFTEAGLNAFAQRIEAPHKQRIAELEKDCEILQTNLDAALMQVKQLREALQGFLDAFNGGYEPSLQTVFIASKAMEQTK